MNTLTIKKPSFLENAWIERIILAALFVGIGLLIYLVFSPYRPLIESHGMDYLGRLGLILLLLAAVVLTRKNSLLHPYRPVLIGLLIMMVTVTLDYMNAIFLLKHLAVNTSIPSGLSMQKLSQSFIIIFTVVSLTLLSGGTLGSIYIQKGRLKLGLLTGFALFLLAAAGSTFMSYDLFKGRELTVERITGWLPWVLIFVLANAAQEELLFRGLFLRKLQPFFGGFVSNLLIMFVFTLLHYGVTYASSDLKFTLAVGILALGWGYLMQKTNAIWASILFHAGMDIPILLGMFSNL
jgi:membrane protease YdiL (CAAX protease family)